MQRRLLLVAVVIAVMALTAACTDPWPIPLPKLLRVEPAGTLNFGDDVDELLLFIDNLGGGPLQWRISVAGGAGWLTVDPTSGVDGATVSLTVDRSGLAPGSLHSAELTVESNGGTARRTVLVSRAAGETPPDPDPDPDPPDPDPDPDPPDPDPDPDPPDPDPDPPLPPPGPVHDLTVTGFTLPVGVLDGGWIGGWNSGWTGGTDGFGISTGSRFGFGPGAVLHELVRQLDRAVLGAGFGAGFGTDFGADWSAGAGSAFGANSGSAFGHSFGLRSGSAFDGRGGFDTASPMPAGYEGAFVLSWLAVDDADAYRIYAEDSGDRTLAEEVGWAALEFDGDGYAIYVLRDDFPVGAVMTYSVVAVNEEGTEGDASATDSGIIMEPARLAAPSSGSFASARPRLQWHGHPLATAYGLYVAEGDVTNTVWHVVVDGNVEAVTYPGDDPGAAPDLADGHYVWFVAARGPVLNGKTGGMAVSADWFFTVEEGGP